MQASGEPVGRQDPVGVLVHAQSRLLEGAGMCQLVDGVMHLVELPESRHAVERVVDRPLQEVEADECDDELCRHRPLPSHADVDDQKTSTFSASRVHVVSSSSELRLVPSTSSASAMPRASMQDEHTPTSPPWRRTVFSMSSML